MCTLPRTRPDRGMKTEFRSVNNWQMKNDGSQRVLNAF